MLALDAPTEVRCGDRAVRVEPDGDVSFADRHGRRVNVDLSSSTHVALWSAPGWCCLVGIRGRDVVVIRPSEDDLHIAGQLDRLDLRGGYDPGGLHRIEMREVNGGDVLVVHEVGVARVSSAGILWQRRHEDITARVTDVVDGVVWLAGELERFGYDLEYGDPRFTTEI
jgi:hypothetical protein